MPLDVKQLLAGPRGRRFCLEFALSGRGEISAEQTRLGQLLFPAVFQLESAAGRASLVFGTDGPLPAPSIEQIASALGNVPLGAVSDMNVLLALTEVVDSAMYWQEPDGTDELLSDPAIHGALETVAHHLLASPLTSWLSSSEAPEQWAVTFEHRSLNLPLPPAAAESLRLWQTEQRESEQVAGLERPMDPSANWSGDWWSTPSRALTTSTRSLSPYGPVGLSLIEDSRGWTRGEIELVLVPDASRIFEVVDAASWVELCREYPLDVSASRRHDWYRATGRSGMWVIPDWARVAPNFDAVHLPVSTYLSSAGVPITVTADTASVIAGWNPDETFWLVDVEKDPATRANLVRDEHTELWPV